MVKKIIGSFGIAGALALVVGVGCSATVTNTVTDGGTTPTAEAGPTPPIDSGKPKTDGGGGGGGACYSENDALAIEGAPPVKNAGKCTAAQLTDLDAKCLATASTEATCTAYIDANKDCARCVFGALQGDDEKTTPMPALIPVSEDSIAPNVGACAALVIGRPDCAQKLTVQEVCLESACSLCDTDPGYEACRTEAAAKICKDVMDAACTKAVDDAKAQWTPICDGADFDAAFKKVGAYMCGGAGAPTDAGGGG